MIARRVESGAVFGFGGTNARIGISNEGDITNFQSVPTPQGPPEFFGWMSHQILDAADNGANWVVAGFPGPVTADGKVGPMVNVPGLSKDRYNLKEQLAAADPAMRRLIEDDDFTIVPTNDGPMHANAAATRIGEYHYDRVGALIDGSGVGYGQVRRDSTFGDVYRVDDSNPLEVGHIPLSANPFDTYENRVSGPALKRTYGMRPEDMPADHPAWKVVGEHAGNLAVTVGLMTAPELIVITGGVGAGGSENYEPHLRSTIDAYRYGNGAQKLFLPEVRTVPSSEAQIFELYGAEGIMRDRATR